MFLFPKLLFKKILSIEHNLNFFYIHYWISLVTTFLERSRDISSDILLRLVRRPVSLYFFASTCKLSITVQFIAPCSKFNSRHANIWLNLYNHRGEYLNMLYIVFSLLQSPILCCPTLVFCREYNAAILLWNWN